MVKVVSRICPLDLMMKYVQFQVKKRLSHEVLKVTVESCTTYRLDRDALYKDPCGGLGVQHEASYQSRGGLYPHW